MQRRLDDLERKVHQLEAKIAHLIMPMTQAESTTETTGSASVQMNYIGGNTASQTPIQQNYGFWSRPLLGALHIIANMAGLAGRGVSIASTDERYRPLDLQEGDVTLADGIQRVWLSNGNTINITGGAFINMTTSETVTITCPSVVMSGNLTVAGDILDKDGSQANNMRDMRTIFDTHTHGGIQGGSGHTAIPDQTE
jgi:phage gp45-like